MGKRRQVSTVDAVNRVIAAAGDNALLLSERRRLLDALDAVPRSDAFFEREWGNAHFADWQRERDRRMEAEADTQRPPEHIDADRSQVVDALDKEMPFVSREDCEDAADRLLASGVVEVSSNRPAAMRVHAAETERGRQAARAERAERERDRLRADNERLRATLRLHKHTQECLHYAAQTGKPFCIANCADSYGVALSADADADAEPCSCGHARTQHGASGCNQRFCGCLGPFPPEPSRAEGDTHAFAPVDTPDAVDPHTCHRCGEGRFHPSHLDPREGLDPDERLVSDREGDEGRSVAGRWQEYAAHLTNRVRELEAALRFYADWTSWDRGKRARAALKGSDRA